MTPFFEQNLEDREFFGGDIILRDLANVDRSDSRMDLIRNPLKTKPLPGAIGKDKLLLGSIDEDFTQPATIPYDGKSFGMIVVAPRGYGKTQWIKHFAFSQLYERFGYNLFIVDPKDDYKNVETPTKEVEFVKRMMRFGIKPHGFQVKYFKPAFANFSDRRGTEYILTLKDIKALEWGKRSETIMDIFADDELSSSARAAIEMTLQKAVPESIDGLRRRLKQYKVDTIKERKKLATEAGATGASKMVSFKADQIIERKIALGYLGDSGQFITRETEEIDGKIVVTKKVKAFAADFPAELASGGGPNIVIVQTDLSASSAQIFSIYVKMSIARIWDDRWKYYNTDGREGVMNRPTFVVTDEADTLLPRKGYSASREQFNQLLTKGRQPGWGVICVTQKPWMISSDFIDNTGYVVGTAIDDDMAALLKSKFSFQDYILEDLRKLKRAKAGQMPEWFCASGNEDTPIVTYFAIPPQVEIIKERIPVNEL